MQLFFIAIFGSYILFILLLLTGWRRALKFPITRPSNNNGIRISIIVPVRNEAVAITHLLESLLKQSWVAYEIVVVNDHSEDNTVDVVKKIARDDDRVRILNLGEESGKKEAITKGVDAAQGQVIVTTDGDCIVPPHWLEYIAVAFHDPAVQLAFGGVRIAENVSGLSRLQAMEFAPLILTGAATLSLGFPTMCNGANLAFRKSTFMEVHGYKGNLHIASGDDEFLLRKVHDKYPQGILFLNTPDAVVETRPATNFQTFFGQRLRWASKWRAHNGWASRLTALYVLLFHLSAIGLLVTTIAAITPFQLAIVLFGSKVIGEAILLLVATRFLKIPFRWLSFVLLQLFYSFYVLIAGLGANVLTVEWKGRRVGNKELTTPDPSTAD